MQRSHGNSLSVRRGIVGCLLVLLLAGIAAYGVQFQHGLGVTGLSRNVPWGLYISQFTFLVGIAASSVLLILPRYVHGKLDCAPLVIVGETVSIVALIEAMTFVLVDLGRPDRVLAIFLYPAPTSLMFWDILTLTGYLLLCLTILTGSLLSPHGAHQAWLRPLVLLSIPFAFGIHVVTALLYSGLAARGGWMSAILAPKFLATAFASGSALLLLLGSALTATRTLIVDRAAIARLAAIMTYALSASLLFSGLEAFTSLYSGIASSREHLHHLFVPDPENPGLAVGMLASTALSLVAIVVLLRPSFRRSPRLLYLASGAVLVSVLLEKGLVFIPSGFAPSALGEATDYHPSFIELLIACGIHAGGLLALIALLGPIASRARALQAHLDDNTDDALPPRSTFGKEEGVRVVDHQASA
jgi:Ni/Fe-hydrogenase subunit HybB-like protein